MRTLDGLRFLLVGTAALSLAAGCGGAVEPGPFTATTACFQLQDASARRAARCSGGAAADWRALEASFANCATYDKHVADGQVEYRRAAFDACLASFERPCDQSPGQTPCMFEVLFGLVPDGQPCQGTEVCGPKSVCLSVVPEACSEVCVSAGTVNQRCGIYCGDTTPCFEAPLCEYGLVCVGDICIEGQDVRQPCGGPELLTCTPPLFCTADLASDPTSTGVCAAPIAGGPCRADSECLLSEFCVDAVCSPRREVGMSCADAPKGCVPWTACDTATLTCVSAGRLATPCAPYPGAPEIPYCLAGGTCLGEICGPAPVGPGQSCAGPTCAMGSTCDPESLICVACPS